MNKLKYIFIARHEPVVMVARPEDDADARARLQDAGAGAVTVVAWDISDSWVRDTGPTFLLGPGGALGGVDWGFNAWGMTYTDFAPDARLARRILDHAGARRFPGPMILEGGAFSVDGDGTVLVTEECLLHDNRNPHLTRADVEDVLRGWLGVETVVWLPCGLADDETDGHVDEVACFAAPGIVVLMDGAGEADPVDPNTARTAACRRALGAARDARGRRLTIISLPFPKVKVMGSSGRLTLSYANFYIGDQVVVVPAYGDAADDRAAGIIASAFPGRSVVQVPGLDVCRGGGNVHCITQQEPAPATTGDAGIAEGSAR